MKRILIAILCFMMLNNSVFASPNGSGLVGEEIVLGKDGLNIIDCNEDSLITRAEMVDILIKFTQIHDDEAYGTLARSSYSYYNGRIVDYQPFTDWEIDDEKSECVRRLYTSSIIRGDGDGRFRPDEACTYAEAVTLIIRVLGWAHQAEYLGASGFPSGYICVAEELGLLDEPLEVDETEIYDDVVKIIFKSLFVPMLERAHYYTRYMVYESGLSALENFHGMRFKHGDAVKEENGIIIDDESFVGEVYALSDFQSGEVLCIYKTEETVTSSAEETTESSKEESVSSGNEKNTVNSIVLCIAIDDFEWLTEEK